MSIQTIKSANGKPKYVLLPIAIYDKLRDQIVPELDYDPSDYVPFDPADYVSNPVALERIKACISQKELATRMQVSQAYVSKLEHQEKISPKTLLKVKTALQLN